MIGLLHRGTDVAIIALYPPDANRQFLGRIPKKTSLFLYRDSVIKCWESIMMNNEEDEKIQDIRREYLKKIVKGVFFTTANSCVDRTNEDKSSTST